MREAIVFSCYAMGVLTIIGGIILARDAQGEVQMLIAASALLSCVFIFGFGYICDKLGSIELILSDIAKSDKMSLSTNHQKSMGPNELPREFGEPRYQDGMAVIDTAEGEMQFPNMSEARRFLESRGE